MRSTKDRSYAVVHVRSRTVNPMDPTEVVTYHVRTPRGIIEVIDPCWADPAPRGGWRSRGEMRRTMRAIERHYAAQHEETDYQGHDYDPYFGHP